MKWKPIAIPLLATRIEVRELTIKDLDAMYEVCCSNPYYFKCMNSTVKKASLQEDLISLPPGKTKKDKAFLGYFYQDALLGFMDLIYGYPTLDCLYIGWFMLHRQYQGKGIAKCLLQETLKQVEGYQKARLAHVKGNMQAEHFWLQQGFHHTGEEVEMELYEVQLMEKALK